MSSRECVISSEVLRVMFAVSLCFIAGHFVYVDKQSLSCDEGWKPCSTATLLLTCDLKHMRTRYLLILPDGYFDPSTPENTRQPLLHVYIGVYRVVFTLRWAVTHALCIVSSTSSASDRCHGEQLWSFNMETFMYLNNILCSQRRNNDALQNRQICYF